MPLCTLRQFRISSALDDGRQLSPSLRSHIDACPSCRKFHQQSCAIAVDFAPRATDPPPWLHTKIMGEIQATTQDGGGGPASLRRWLPASVGLAAIATVAALIMFNVQEAPVETEQAEVVLRPPIPPHPASVPGAFESHAKQALSREFHHLATDIAGAKNFLTASLLSTIPGLAEESP